VADARAIIHAARGAVVACAVLAVGAVLWLVARRIGYPFELDWMEGGVLHHVQRIVAKQPLYVSPTLDFIPFIYPPGYYYAAAGMSMLFGDGFFSLRLVSVVSSFGVMAIAGLFVWRETGDRVLAVTAFGLVAATYGAGGFWFDLARVDMLFLVLILSGFYAIRFGSSRVADVSAGLLLAAAFLTKQSAAVMAAPVALWLLVVDWRRAAVVIGVGGATSVGATVGLDAVHQGWYRFYLFELPSQYRLFPGRLMRFWTEDLLYTMPVAMAFAAFYGLRLARTSERLFHVAMASGLVTGAWMSRANDGGYLNVLIPAFVALALLTVLAIHGWLASEEPPHRMRASWPYAAVLAQFMLLAYDPRAQVPGARSVSAGEHLVRTLEAAKGPVWVPYHSYLTTRAGKPGHAHWMAVSDIFRYGAPGLKNPLRQQLDRAIAGRRFALVVQSSRPFPDFPSIDHAYRLERTLFQDDGDALMTLTGGRRRPEAIYVPR
jgi:4-amino-4-deoxy-L-arabinose transferase-like glycosyltransferase